MTKRYRQFDELVVSDFEVDKWHHPVHNHTYYELIYIVKGEGKHCLNGKSFPYEPGDLYLLGPEDTHSFKLESRTRFIFFKFQNQYVTKQLDMPKPDAWGKELEQLLHHPRRKTGNLLTNKADREMVYAILQMIVHEYKSIGKASEEIISQLFSVIVLMIKRGNNTSYSVLNWEKRPGKMEEILDFIDVNIQNPKKLSLQHLADMFHYSPNYFGIFFKKQMDTTLRDYVNSYRMKLLEQRLKFSQDGLKQIASDFGFVDESHFTKFFSKHNGDTPSRYRG